MIAGTVFYEVDEDTRFLSENKKNLKTIITPTKELGAYKNKNFSTVACIIFFCGRPHRQLPPTPRCERRFCTTPILR